MTYIHISGNFAKEGQCGKCKHFILIGTCTGVCDVNDYNNCMSGDSCDKYESGECQID